MNSPNQSRISVVYVRKSTSGQDETGQVENIKKMLESRGIVIEEKYWFFETVSRRKVSTAPVFNQLLRMVENDEIEAVYVESQDRWGTTELAELFFHTQLFRQHGTKLIDLKVNEDIASNNSGTIIKTVMNSIKSREELNDLAFRSLRTKVSRLQKYGSWPTGCQPFGFGKACYSPDGILKWVWQPESRTRGQIFYPNGLENFLPGPSGEKIRRKERADKLILVPCNNQKWIKAVVAIFDLYTRAGLSRRKISANLNAQGFDFYGKPFTHSIVTQILGNPAYVGDTHFGKMRRAKVLRSFTSTGDLIEIEPSDKHRKRDVSDRIVLQETHEGLISREMWDLAREKLEFESSRRCHPPRNPNYYLKNVLVCGHCGKTMTARTEIDPRSRKKRVVYVCSTYTQSRCNGTPITCGYQRITHNEAEKLLLDKIRELKLPHDSRASRTIRKGLKKQLQNMETNYDELRGMRWECVQSGYDALIELLESEYQFSPKKNSAIAMHAKWCYKIGKISKQRPGFQLADIAVEFDVFRKVIEEAEKNAVDQAKEKVERLEADLTLYVDALVRAEGRKRAVMEKTVNEIEAEIKEWEPRTVPISKRIEKLVQAEAEWQRKYDDLLRDWPGIECRERGESIGRVINSVTLYWDKEFIPANPNPSTPRKTNRKGRFKYTLQPAKYVWDIPVCDVAGSW